MQRELDFQGILLPTLLLIFLAAAVLFWLLDGFLARRGFYGQVWHPSLFRVSLFVCMFAALGLFVYR